MRNRRGFTLIDLMTVSALMLIFGAALFGTFSTMRNAMARQDTYFDANRSARMAIEWISRDVKEAVRVDDAHGADATSGSVLVLALPSLDAAGEPTDIENDFDYVVYKLDSSVPPNLVRELDVFEGTSFRGNGSDETRIVAKGMAGLGFSSDGDSLDDVVDLAVVKTLNVEVQGQGTSQGATQTSVLDSDLVLRNNVDD